MLHEEYRKTLNELYRYDGVSGLIGYFVNHEKLSVEDAKAKASAWGYGPVVTFDEGGEERFEASLARASSSNDEVTLNNPHKGEQGFFHKIFGI